MNRYLIVLAAMVGGEQRTAVLLGQVGYGLNKRLSSYTNFKNILTGELRIPIEVLLRLKAHNKNLLLPFFQIRSGK